MAKKKPKLTTCDVAAVAAALQSLQRQRQWHLKSRNMVANRLQSTVAGTLGYHNGMDKKERAALYKQATKVIAAIKKGGPAESDMVAGIVKTTSIAIAGFQEMKLSLENEMVAIAKTLPVAPWVEAPEQRGFGLLFLGIVIGETGDLAGYANPAKVWRRLGCAPWTFDGQTLMGATWRGGKHGKLPSSEWESFGYSPRRRSIAFLIGEGIVKQNSFASEVEPEEEEEESSETEKRYKPVRDAGPYRQRYDEAKVTFAAKHPDYKPLRCHRHAMLLGTKLLLKNLWIQWTGAAKLEL